MPTPIRKFYDEQGNEWKGTWNDLKRNSKHYTERVFECLSEKWVTTPDGNQELAKEQGKLIKEIHYRSDFEAGSYEPYVVIEYIWQNGKEIFNDGEIKARL